MTAEEAVVAAIDALNDLAVPYMLVGSFSSNYYGIARSTQDADFVVQISGRALAELAQRLGPVFRLDPQASFETVTCTTRYIISLANGEFSIEFFLLSDDPHDQERFVRRRAARVLDRTAALPSAEDVVITKLRWSRQGRRSKDVDDARNVIAVQRDFLDWPYVESWCDRHGTRELLESIRRSLPPL